MKGEVGLDREYTFKVNQRRPVNMGINNSYMTSCMRWITACFMMVLESYFSYLPCILTTDAEQMRISDV